MTIRTFLKKILPRGVFGIYHYLLALSAACIYRFPAYQLTVIGVTGTNGKSTCVYMINEIFKEAGHKTCSASSINFTIGNQEEPNMLKMTMAGPFTLQRFLRKAVNAGARFAVLEITSEGILQNRHRFIPIHTAVFTNLSREHVERHGSFEAYRTEKAKIFQGAQCTVVNCDDKQAEYFLKISAPEKYGYTFHVDKNFPALKKFFVVQNFISEENSTTFRFGDMQFHLSLPGEFNARNATEAIIAATIHGISLAQAKQALERIYTIPGRMEIVIEKPVKVIVDYAHTPVALRSVYEMLRSANSPRTTSGSWCPEPYVVQGKLICVLGATGGGRDKWKRPEFGKLAAAYCDYIILTDEDPYDEDPTQIISQVKAGISESFSGVCEEILDREKAIARALEVARINDVVIITGKGSEPYMVTGRGKVLWDDRAIARKEWEKRL